MKWLFGFVIALTLSSCGGNQQTLKGKWSLERIDYSEHFEDSPKDVKELLLKKMDEEFERLKGKTFFVFHEDLKLELLSPDLTGKIVAEEGTYTMNKNQDSVFFELMMPESFRVVKLDSKELVLKTDELPKRTLFLKKSK
jgi:hypothetical protein